MNRGRDWSIGQRLGAGFVLFLAVLAGLAAAVYYWDGRSADAQRAFSERIVPLSEAGDVLERRLLYVGLAVRAYLIHPGLQERSRYDSQVGGANAALTQLGALPKEPDGDAQYRTLKPEVEAYLAEAARVVGQTRGSAASAGAAERSLAEARERALARLGDFADLQQQKTHAALSAIQAARMAQSTGYAAAGVLALLLLAGVGLLTARSIRDPARDLVRVAEALERGDWRPALAQAATPRSGPVNDEMLKLAHAFGAAAVALERRELRLRADRQVARATGASLSKDAIAASALEAICAHMGAEVGVLYWKEGGELVPIARHALNGAVERLSVGEGVPGQAAKMLRPVVVRDIPADSPFAVKIGYDRAAPRCVAAVPVAVREDLIGVLLVASLRELDEEALAFLEAAGAQLGIGLQNVKSYEEVQRLLGEIGESNERIQAQNEELQAQNEELQAQGEEIQSQNEELQAQGEEIQSQNDQLKARTDQLSEQASSLAEADRRKTEFLGVLAHELRNPMAAISNGLYALVRAGRNAEMRGRAEQVIDRQTRMLARLVDDLLDVTRIASGKVRLQKERVDLAEVVRECSEDYRGAAEKAGVALRVEVPEAAVTVEGDRTRLCQVLGNLLDNAIKFGGERPVSVELEARGGRAELRVSDSGIGIDDEVRARLFQPFSQADTSLARRKAGLGLGLALVKALVGLHGGEVEAKSDGLGRGARFTVRLPLAEFGRRAEAQTPGASERHEAGRADRRTAARRGRRVLIIEDNPDAAAMLKDSMELNGHEVRVANDAHQGIQLAYDFRPDVLLCDIGLPTMDGYQVANRFRTDERLKSVFLIAVTGYAAPDDQERAAQAGFDRHFGKPPDIERLQQIIDQISLA